MNQDRPRDQIYAQSLEAITDFRFDETVARVFPDMINRSVPGYSTLVNLLGVVASRYAVDNSRIYDLGCSLGAASLSIRHHLQHQNCYITAVDNSVSMIERAQVLIDAEPGETPIELQCSDIRDVLIDDASVVVLNFTLQFLQPDERLAILEHIHNGMRRGGILILSEKIQLENDSQNERFIELHHDFKKANGYSELEISQKRSALERVLIPETTKQHTERLAEAGFVDNEIWFQCLNFVSLMAHKP
ncbi:MAG: carboxy-S-adenosyl-L-methionine synthase CmoA [Gammaproteobacteria bacterium]|nr:carboxy-S-adenosyl-L-methionine synthase CmoA [Gammaproteobacteria bacterium]